ncbi:hypothetical protein C8R45DRAFT_945237 [Mycena sanguinolenta]|nr:hypothetical protein C8R45DRAFT_945237 [Mycena sanguinolenta]
MPDTPITVNSKFLTVHPCLAVKKCMFSHIISGEIRTAKLECRPWGSKMLIFVPVQERVETLHQAIVILPNPHNHPMHPRGKPSAEDKFKLGTVVDVAGLTGLTVQKLLGVSFQLFVTSLVESNSWNMSSALYIAPSQTLEGFESSPPKSRKHGIRTFPDIKQVFLTKFNGRLYCTNLSVTSQGLPRLSAPPPLSPPPIADETVGSFEEDDHVAPHDLNLEFDECNIVSARTVSSRAQKRTSLSVFKWERNNKTISPPVPMNSSLPINSSNSTSELSPEFNFYVSFTW